MVISKFTQKLTQRQYISEPAKLGEVGGKGSMPPPPAPTFFQAKEKLETKQKKERVSKQKLLKGCHQGQNIIV